MKLLVSTAETQGRRNNDFCFLPEGELVTYSVIECSGEKPDGACGCKRSMSGLVSRKGTTTLRVIEVSITQKQFAERVYHSMKAGGWVSLMGEKNARKFAKLSTSILVQAIKKIPVGSTLERRGDRFQPRTSI